MAEQPVSARAMGAFVGHGPAFWVNDPTVGRTTLSGWGMFNEWKNQAACQDTDIRLWFGDEHAPKVKKASRSKEQTAQAKEICAACPVLQECREWALRVRLPFGIVAGMTEVERLRALVERDQAKQRPVTRALGQQRTRELRTCVVCDAQFYVQRKDQRTCSTGCSYSWRWRSRASRAC
jgi:WhiB family transcriptional regulator, redox-sensing transcriptional regulator